MNNILDIKGIKKSFSSGREKINVLKGVNLEVKSGNFVSILGPSGSGKSTLLHIIGGLQRPDNGEVLFHGKSLYSNTDRELALIRNTEIGFIFQFHHLLSDFTVLENIIIPQLIKGEDIKKARNRAMKLMEKVDISERSEHKPATLSGGEKQRVAILRAIINQPSIILADEPTGDLDYEHANQILEILKKLNHENEVAIIMVTHDMRVAKIARHIYYLKKGVLKEKNEM